MKYLFILLLIAGCNDKDDCTCSCKYWYQTRSQDGKKTYLCPSNIQYSIGDTMRKNNLIITGFAKTHE
jgi:hypothetical protein